MEHVKDDKLVTGNHMQSSLVGFTERMEQAKAHNVTPTDFVWAANIFTGAIDRRRALVDEMEKLIGVRDLVKHPDGIRGGAIALLGITDQLEPVCAGKWKDFVISTLLQCLDNLGTNEEITAKIQANEAASDLAFYEAFTGYTDMVTKLPLDPAVVDKYKRLYIRPNTKFSTIDDVQTLIAEVIKAQRANLVGDPSIGRENLPSRLKNDCESILWGYLTPERGVTLKLDVKLKQRLDSIVTAEVTFNGVRHVLTFDVPG